MPVTCTISNTRTSADLVLQKEWVNGADGDTADLSVTGADVGSATSTATGAAGSEIDGDNRADARVFSGETVSLAEVLGTDNTGSYTSEITCDQPGLTPDADGRGGSFAVPATPQPVTCTISNTRTSAVLVLQKEWVNGAADDTADLSITGRDPTVSATSTSTATGAAGSETDTANAATARVYSGQRVVLAEAFGANRGTYAVNLTCTDPAGLVYRSHGETGIYAVPDTPQRVTCTFTNTRTSATITLQKEWVDAAAGDTAHLSVTGSDPGTTGSATSTATGAAGSETDTDNTATAPIYSGETVDLVENLGSGNTGSYTSEITCDSRGRTHPGRRRTGRQLPGARHPGAGDLHDHQHPHRHHADPAEAVGQRRHRRLRRPEHRRRQHGSRSRHRHRPGQRHRIVHRQGDRHHPLRDVGGRERSSGCGQHR